MKRALAACLIIIAVALALRVPKLADRPMHADEAVLADKFGTLLETGYFAYDPHDCHGPMLAWLTVVPAWLTGVHQYRNLTEITVRSVSVVCGLLLVLAPLLLMDALGRWQAIAAAGLTAISPAMVFYSRYYIPEMLLAVLTFAVILFGYHYARTLRPAWALAAGAALGLMFAAKETAGIAAVCMLIALASVVRQWPRPVWPVVAALGVAAVIALTALGPGNSLTAVLNYSQRALRDPIHRHPWYYYAALPGWAEGLIPILAIVSAILVRNRFQRFLAAYSCAIAIAYSLIPYKTPWCIINALHPTILLAGVGLVTLLRKSNGVARLAVASAAIVWVASLGLETWRTSFLESSSQKNSYVYAHTGRDIFVIRDRVDSVARSHPDGHNMNLQVVSTENLWPLPWYLRAFPHVEWWRQAGAGFHPADVILATPGMEPALIHEMYEAPPPGQRDLYVPLFDRYVELRPKVEVRGYVRANLAH